MQRRKRKKTKIEEM